MLTCALIAADLRALNCRNGFADKPASLGRPVLRERLEVGEAGAPAGHSAVVRGAKPDIDFEKVSASSRAYSGFQRCTPSKANNLACTVLNQLD